MEMMDGVRRVRRERSDEFRSKQPKEKVVRRDGRVVEISATHVEHLKDKRGLKPVGRNGVSASIYFGLSDAAERYERGPDGLYFVWNDGWEPTNLWRNGAKSPQRDPDGNLWVEQDGEWSLEDEVA